MDDIAVYTGIFGNFDSLKVPLIIPPNVYLFCFTDNIEAVKQYAKIYDIQRIEIHEDLGARKTARMYKILGHELFSDFKINVWLDGSIRAVGDINRIINLELNDKYDLAIYKHFERNCIYDEAKACISLRKDDKDIINKQISIYK